MKRPEHAFFLGCVGNVMKKELLNSGIYSFMEMEPMNEDVFCYFAQFQIFLEPS